MEFLKEEIHLLMQDTKQVFTLPIDQEVAEEEEFDEKLIHLAII